MGIISDTVSLFGNVRTPAALIGGASLTLGFAFQAPIKTDKKLVKGVKAIILALGFLSVQSELLCVVISTNAINRLTAGLSGVNVAGATTVLELMKNDRSLLQYWLGTYIHFMAGVFGVVLTSGLRGWLAVGPRWGAPILALTAAIFTRLLAAVNRGIVAQEFGSGNAIILGLNFIRTFTINTVTRRRWFDSISLLFLVLSGVLLTQRCYWLFRDAADDDGDGILSPAEFTAYVKETYNDLKEDLEGPK